MKFQYKSSSECTLEMYLLADKTVDEGECGERERGKDSRTEKWAGEMEAPREHPFHLSDFHINMLRSCNEKLQIIF